MFHLDFSAIEAAAQLACNGPRFEALPKGVFPAPSLTRWMALAADAGVPSVPAEEVGRVTIDAVLRFDTPDTPGVAEAMAILDRVNAQLDGTCMLRWDCCAGGEIKYSLSQGQIPSDDARCLVPDDPRAFDLLYEFPADDIALLKRPWVLAQAIENYPLEFRVFVEDGAPVAIANYYLQRDLPDTPAIRAAAAQSLAHTRAILAALARSGEVPGMPGQPDPERVAATLDFLVTEDGQVLFLEAGPGHFFGAHPCAFLRPDQRTVDALEGLRLASGGPNVPLASL